MATMDRVRKLELIQRSLGLRHKLKVHESMEAPETHDELSLSLLAKWELEDELAAIEEILADDRRTHVDETRSLIEKSIIKKRSSGTGTKKG